VIRGRTLAGAEPIHIYFEPQRLALRLQDWALRWWDVRGSGNGAIFQQNGWASFPAAACYQRGV